MEEMLEMSGTFPVPCLQGFPVRHSPRFTIT